MVTTIDILYAGTWGDGLYRSTDHGTTWLTATTGITLPMYVKDGLAVNPVTPTILFAGDYYGTASGGGIYRSTDGGDSWQVSLDSVNVDTLLIHPLTPTLVFAGIRDKGLYRSADNGESWQATSFPATRVSALAAAESLPGPVYAGGGNRLYASGNGGISWSLASTLSSTVQSLAVHPLTATTLYAGTRSHGLWRSLDGGASWLTDTVTGLPADAWITSIAIHPITPTTLYVGDWFGQVYQSTDGGDTWTALGYLGTVQDILIHPQEPSVIYAATSNNGVFRGSTLDHVTMSPVDSPQYVSHTFPITLTAYDALGFPLTGMMQVEVERFLTQRLVLSEVEGRKDAKSQRFFDPYPLDSAQSVEANLAETLMAGGYDGTATLTDTTGTLVPGQVAFADGVATAEVSVGVPVISDVITAEVAGAPAVRSDPFDVRYAPVAGFTFDAIPDQTAGVAFPITITARDAEGVLVPYTGTVTLTDTTGTLAPVQAGPFVAGTWSGSGIITRAHVAVVLTARDGALTGTSESFAVAPGAVDHLVLAPAPFPDQTASVPFTLTVQAQDAYDNLALQHNGPLTLTDRTGTLQPATAAFNAGAWQGTGVITQPQTGVVLTATTVAVAQRLTAVSTPFDVTPPQITHFTFAPLGRQFVDEPFTVRITARNAFGLPTLYTGTNTLTDTTGTVSPTRVGPFVNGVWAGPVTIAQPGSDVALLTTNGVVTGTSNPFTVAPKQISRLYLFPSPMPDQQAGTPFTVIVIAVDQFGEIATHYDGPLSLADSTGTLAPTQGAFTAGVWNGQVTIARAQEDVVLTVQAGGVMVTSTPFDVHPADPPPPLAGFEIQHVPTQWVDVPFTLTLTALDAQGQRVPYTGTAALADTTGTLTPTQAGPFVDGVWRGAVTVAQPGSDVVITATHGLTISGVSNPFAVVSGTLSRLLLFPDPVPDQMAGQPFSITVMAQDARGKLATHYDGPVSLRDSTGTLVPTTVMLDAGLWHGPVTIIQMQEGVVLTATVGPVSVTSNAFAVTDTQPIADEVVSFTFAPVSSQIVGVPFTVTITARDRAGRRVYAYTGRNTLTYTQNSLLLQNVGPFVGGVWTGQVVIPQPYDEVTLVTSNGEVWGRSMPFAVQPNTVTRLFLSPRPLADQQVGVPFTITLQGENALGEPARYYTGAVTLRDSTDTVQPVTATLRAGVWRGPVVIARAQDAVVLTATVDGVAAQSTPFAVTAPSTCAVSSFMFDFIAPQKVGVPFSLTITARDAVGQPAAFTGTVALTDTTGTVTPPQAGPFVDGVWTGSVTVGQVHEAVVITASHPCARGGSNPFPVTSDAVGRLFISPAPMPDQYAMQPFNITVLAQDAEGNLAQRYDGLLALRDNTGTLHPVTATFQSGVWGGAVTITQAQENVVITATTPQVTGAVSATSMPFTVHAGGPPQATFSADVTQGTAPLTVTFKAVTTGTVSVWHWTFGDGEAAFTGPVVRHTYQQPGTFDVGLTVLNAYGEDTVPRPAMITVIPRDNERTLYLPLIVRQ